MKLVSFLVGCIFFASAQADVIKCTFTEPFISLEYSMTQSSLKISGADISTYTIKNVSFQIFGPGSFELWDKNKNAVVILQMDFNGSDGMSDYTYPYSASYDGVQGGCTSNFAPKKMDSLK